MPRRSVLVNGLVAVIVVGIGALIACEPTTPDEAPTLTITDPTITSSPSFQPTATMVRSQVTWTPIPTLDPMIAEETIRRLLQEDDLCQVPCFWGIIPGQTTLEEARQIYRHLNMPFRLTFEQGGNKYYEAGRGFDDGTGIVIEHVVQDGIVRSLSFGIGNSKRSSALNEWSAYAPTAVLDRYGVPSAVDFIVNYPAEPGAPANLAWYHMILYFADSNLIIDYNNGYTNSGERIHACPLTDRFEGIGAWLGKDSRNPPPRGIPLEKATSLTLTQLYEMLRHGSETACFDLLLEAFNP